MKKALSLVLFLTILFTSSLSLADAQVDFMQFAYKLTSSTPSNFFMYPSGICFGARFAFNKLVEDIFADEKSRCEQTASKLLEFEYSLLANSAISDYFGGLQIEVDLTQPSYIGRDGNIVSCYAQGTDCGYFTLYDLTTHLVYAVPISPKVQKKVESVLFERCADGYYVNEPETLKEQIEFLRGLYDEALAEFNSPS
ncbi:MAG: hypothetical protein PUD16_10835 [bacterium]|nr:hypothetical protein [bacterium]